MYIYADVNIYMWYTYICVPYEYTGYMHMYIYADILFVWYTYICVYIYMCTPRMYTHIYADIHIYMCTSRNQAIEIFTDEYKSIYVNIQGTCICIYTRIYTYICVYMCMQIYTYICVYMCICGYTHIYVYICADIHIYMCIYVCIYADIYTPPLPFLLHRVPKRTQTRQT